MHVWVNGRLLDASNGPARDVTGHGFGVGDGVFESVKAVHGHPFALTRHLRRLAHAAATLDLPPLDERLVRSAVEQALAEEQSHLARLRITYTAGPVSAGSPGGHGPATLVVVAEALRPWAPVAEVVVVPWVRNERGALAGLKTTAYAGNLAALAYARERGAGEAIFANTAGRLCEGTSTNVFYVVDGELRTPSLASGCLGGITRELVIEWCGAVAVDEPVEILRAADEVFLASTTRNVQPVGRVDGRQLPAPGPVTARAMESWAVREAEQIDP